MKTKRVAIEQLSGAALQYALKDTLGVHYDATDDWCRAVKIRVLAFLKSSGYVEVPVELVEENSND
jgi:hypothetical protein